MPSPVALIEAFAARQSGGQSAGQPRDARTCRQPKPKPKPAEAEAEAEAEAVPVIEDLRAELKPTKRSTLGYSRG